MFAAVVLEDLPRRHADDACFDAFALELFVGIDAERNLTARGQQQDVGFAVVGICQNIRPALHALG